MSESPAAPLRILHAIRSTAFAGVEQFVARLAVAQAAEGHAVHVIGGDPARMEPRLRDGAVTFTEVTDRTVAVMRELRRNTSEVDIVNTHMTAADVAAAIALGGGSTTPAVVSTRHFASRRGRAKALHMDALIGPRIDAEISISQAVAEAIGRPSTVVHSGVEDAADSAVPRRRTVLIAQRLESEKRTDLGIRAFASSGLAAEGWTLEIAGTGAERARLQSLADGLDVDARFLGFRDDLPALMQTAGILLAPCTVEGLGLAVLEAMASGLPVVAADAGGHTEILSGMDHRALYTPEDPEAAAHSLRSLAADEALRNALGVAGRARQRSAFSIAAQVEGTDAVYRRAIMAREGR